MQTYIQRPNPLTALALSLACAVGSFAQTAGVRPAPAAGPTGMTHVMTNNRPPANSITVSEPSVATNEYFAEATVAVVPPNVNQKCPAGRLVFGSGGLVQPVSLGRAAPLKVVNVGALLGSRSDLTAPHIIFDNQMVATRGGGLVYTVEGVMWRNDVTTEWFQTTKDFPLKGKAVAGGRGAIYVLASDDCGDTWRVLTVVDAAKLAVKNPNTKRFEQGYCGWPRKNADGKTTEAGGWDGHYAYSDPFNGLLYITTVCATSRGPWQGLLLLSRDRGQNWATIWQTDAAFWRNPVTSLANGTLAVALSRGSGSSRKAYVQTFNGITPVGEKEIAAAPYPSDKDTAADKMSNRVGLNANMYAYLGLARAGAGGGQAQAFRLAAFGDEGGDAIYRIFSYDPQKPAPALLSTIKAAAAGNSVLHGTFVESLGQSRATIFYWLEQKSKGKFQVHFKPFIDNQAGGAPQALSSEFATPTFTGDYIGGTSYQTATGHRFFLSWSEAGVLKFVDVSVNLSGLSGAPAVSRSRGAPLRLKPLPASVRSRRVEVDELLPKTTVLPPNN
jgi:hypothetical protein